MAHLFPRLGVQGGERGGLQLFKGLPALPHGVKGPVLHLGYRLNVGGDLNAPAGQDLKGDAPGDAQGGGQPPGEVPSPRHILKAAIPHLGGVVGVAGAGHIVEGGIVL